MITRQRFAPFNKDREERSIHKMKHIKVVTDPSKGPGRWVTRFCNGGWVAFDRVFFTNTAFFPDSEKGFHEMAVAVNEWNDLERKKEVQ
jgi:hypothetical protein